MTIESVRLELEELKKLRIDLQAELNSKENEARNSKEYQELRKSDEDLQEQYNKIRIKIREEENVINSQFLTGSGESPSYSQTYGKNIKPEVIEAIKKTFDFKKLSGSSIESIVGRMMDFKQDNVEKIKELRNQQKEIQFKKNKIEGQMQKIYCDAIEEAEKKVRNAEMKIRDKETELTALQMDEGQKVEGVSKYLVKRTLDEYRSECDINFKKVFDNLSQ